uniref:Intracellular sulfur oxidation protein, DsrE/DsrF family n=1 Tax=Candidatus Kentrum sp. TC TaxID=2126339 RepID=A0A450YPC3_9GAMM|nr:MAG: Intracellular sulfur oxidation protein, DsrE/DsrF family [Candidatus Kentron sp. TC]VFK46041.1 MAG: Intracellular sulfur oxidation protein, DsrE/DsrF family [Candidatus Kentron sp. TC]VFK57416.1 MAG: Intracellular sulfur oxidation protein, DsrE/DsrF family [Candidatus Kentron sp. TC]
MLLQVSEDNAQRLNLAPNNARNAQSAFEAENIEIVVFGPGIDTLIHFAPDHIADKVEKAGSTGVRTVARENSPRVFELFAEELSEVGYVESGLAELVEKNRGWNYIHP